MDDHAREPRPTAGPGAHGWIRLEPVLASAQPGVLIVDAIVIDAVVMDPAPVEPGAGAAAATPVGGLGAGPTAARGTPVTLALSLSGPIDTEGGPADLDDLAAAVTEADLIHLFRDEIGAALILRRGTAWWYLEAD